MRVLVVGKGGREHALTWAIRKSPLLGELYATGGNPGIDRIARPVPIDPLDVDALARWAHKQRIDLTVVGPEEPLNRGIVDRFGALGLAVVGPTQRAALLEGSKVFAKELMQRYGIPTARFRVCETPEAAYQVVEEWGAPIVVKADGLAAGKGAIVCRTVPEAKQAVYEIMVEKRFGASGNRVVIEEFLEGEEATVLAFVDGERYIVMEPAQDHKAIYEGDKGPNTGGMGAYSPAPIVSSEVMSQVEERIIGPVVAAMAREGTPYRGILYAGLMITAEGPKVVEFNCRFGDPEAQALIPRLKTDLLSVLLATAQGDLSGIRLEWHSQAAVAVVLASAGYPGRYETGFRIEGLEAAERELDGMLFHCNTRSDGKDIVTAGGRVLTLTALGDTIAEAVDKVYNAVRHIDYTGITYRRDIAHRALRVR